MRCLLSGPGAAAAGAEADVGAGDRHDGVRRAVVVGDDLVEGAPEAPQPLPVTTAPARGAVGARLDLLVHDPASIVDGGGGRARRGVWRESSAAVGVEPGVGRRDVDDDVAPAEVVRDDLRQGPTEAA